MKKVLLSLLILALVLPAVFADDGTVLPGGVFRARVIPVYAWVPGDYDNGGTYKAKTDGSITVPNLGFALEYGITDWITAGLQWAPGITFSSSIPQASPAAAGNLDGLSNLFAGLMVQIVGPKAPVVSDVWRVSIAPGVKIPLAGSIDFASQFANAMAGKAFIAGYPDINTLGIGGRAWLDYVANKSFFIDLYSQFIDYPGKVALKDSSVAGYLVYALSGGATNPDVNYGYSLRFELDPHYNVDIANGVNLAVNCAFRYDSTPAVTWDGAAQTNTATTFYSANPSLDVFFYKSPVPFEVDLDYGQPIAGTNTNSAYTLDMQFKVYFKF
jgi:hypothetical protein